MSEKYKDKYRISTTRLQNWDYGWNASYFVTLCTQNRIHYFGEIVDGKMQLSEIGKFAEKYWYEIPKHFPFVKLDAFVVMPNHIHGIIIIDKKSTTAMIETQNLASQQIPEKVKTQNLASQRRTSQREASQRFGPQSKNLASIIRGYKIGVTKDAKKIDTLWQWQARYYDHIIRNDKAYQNIKEYIINNPKKWNDDKFYEEEK